MEKEGLSLESDGGINNARLMAAFSLFQLVTGKRSL